MLLHFSRAKPASLNFQALFQAIPSFALIQTRHKMVRCQAYHRPDTSAPFGQSPEQRAHIGMRALSSEFVQAGQLLVKQRKYLSKNIHVTRRKHFKYYPGENVTVKRNTSLTAAVGGRLKFTHDVVRDIIYCNVIPEPREELLREDLWRYRTEHVDSLSHNKEVCYLRQKMIPHFPRSLHSPPEGAPRDSDRVGGTFAKAGNRLIRDPLEIEPFPFALVGRPSSESPRVGAKGGREILERHLRGVVHKWKTGIPSGFNVHDQLIDRQRSDAHAM